MTHKERLEFCKICKKQVKDIEEGIVCSLTGERAAFDLKCADFEPDNTLIVKQLKNKKEHHGNISGSSLFNWIGGGIILINLYLFRFAEYTDADWFDVLNTVFTAGFFFFTYYYSAVRGQLWTYSFGWIVLLIYTLSDVIVMLFLIFNRHKFLYYLDGDGVGFMFQLFVIGCITVVCESAALRVLYDRNNIFDSETWRSVKSIRWTKREILYVVYGCAVILLCLYEFFSSLWYMELLTDRIYW